MPITKSAIKKQRTDKRRTEVNKAVSTGVRTALRKVKAKPSVEAIKELYSAVDVAVKKNVLKLNTASRIKAMVVRQTKGKLDKSPFSK